jgi:hypothetical protein
VSVKVLPLTINEKCTAKVEGQMLEVTRAVLMSLEEVGERVVVPGLVKIQALLGHLHIDLEGETGFRGFHEPQYLRPPWKLVAPAVSELFPKRIICVRMRYAENKEQAYLVTWIMPLLMVSQKIVLPLLKKRTLVAPSEAENKPSFQSHKTFETCPFGNGSEGHEELVDRVLEDGRNLVES